MIRVSGDRITTMMTINQYLYTIWAELNPELRFHQLIDMLVTKYHTEHPEKGDIFYLEDDEWLEWLRKEYDRDGKFKHE